MFYISAQNIDCGYSLEPPRRSKFYRHVLVMYILGSIQLLIGPRQAEKCL